MYYFTKYAGIFRTIMIFLETAVHCLESALVVELQAYVQRANYPLLSQTWTPQCPNVIHPKQFQ